VRRTKSEETKGDVLSVLRDGEDDVDAPLQVDTVKVSVEVEVGTRGAGRW